MKTRVLKSSQNYAIGDNTSLPEIKDEGDAIAGAGSSNLMDTTTRSMTPKQRCKLIHADVVKRRSV